MALASYIPRFLPDPSTASSQPHVVVALHGTLGEPFAFRKLARELERRGVGLLAPAFGRRGTLLLDDCAAEITHTITSLPETARRVDIVGHSYGGLVGLRALAVPEVRKRVHTLVGLGACWRGTDSGWWPRWLVRRVIGESFVGLEEHDTQPVVPPNVEVVSIVSDADRVVPASSSSLGRVVHLHGVAHNRLPAQTGPIMRALGC
ncbi:triacylglycerol lipase [Corynebacterium sp. HMSC070H05]|uniref:esterase/lipase family protein n=1 Tax=Corynebacterium sp. HMSC070H05 TaxID=1715096 RepID=UPI0008AA23F2|nr:alpha/beta hydrolase [Corynebacterium sp. HMSC070H05]